MSARPDDSLAAAEDAVPCTCPDPQDYEDEEGTRRCHDCGHVVPVRRLSRRAAEGTAKVLDAVARRAAKYTLGLQSEAPPPTRLLSPAEVAQQTGRSRDWVYDHADELGGRRIGNGPRPRLWFPPDAVARIAEGDRRTPDPVPEPVRSRRRRHRPPGDLLPIRGRDAA